MSMRSVALGKRHLFGDIPAKHLVSHERGRKAVSQYHQREFHVSISRGNEVASAKYA